MNIPHEGSETMHLDNPMSSEPMEQCFTLEPESDPYGPASEEAITVPALGLVFDAAPSSTMLLDDDDILTDVPPGEPTRNMLADDADEAELFL